MKKFLAFICLSFLLLGYDVAMACSCAPSGSPSEELKEAQAVFAGKVVRVREPRSKPVRNRRGRVVAVRVSLIAKISFEVAKVWKGPDKDTILVETMTGCCACGYSFVEGEQYLVYAYGDGKNRLLASICSRTKRLEAAQEDLAELGEGKVPVRRAAPSRERRGGARRSLTTACTRPGSA